MNNFNLYAEYYNLLYRDKNYKAEADYIEELFLEINSKPKTILDLGCGSGNHAYEFFKKGYKVTGVDLSDTMLNLSDELPENNIEFIKGDVRTIKFQQKYDVILSLFHVLSYQQSNEDVIEFFKTVKAHLKPGGVFICDAWYGPGVLSDKPAVRKKELENDSIKLFRIAEPSLHYDKNIVDVNYTMFIKDKITGEYSEINEKHIMRYFFCPELDLFADSVNLILSDKLEWKTNHKLSGSPWNAAFIFLNKGE